MGRAVAVLVLLLLLAWEEASADSGKFRAVFVTWRPYGYLENGVATGFELETFAEVMRRMNIPVVFEERPWKRCLFLVRIGKADAIVSALLTRERETFLHFPEEHISVSKTAFFTTKGSDIRFDGSFEKMKKYNIGVTSGFSYGPAFDEAGFLQKDENIKTSAILVKLLAGRSELGIGNIPVITHLARQMGADGKIRFLKPLVHSQRLYVGFSRQSCHRKLVMQFSEKLRQFKVSGAYARIMKKYGMDVGCD